MHEKIYKCVFVVMLILFAIFFTGFCIQTRRLESSLAECRQYREQLELAERRESDIRESISRTDTILNETGAEVSNLRKKLEALEDCYYDMRGIIYFYSNDTNYSGEKINDNNLTLEHP